MTNKETVRIHESYFLDFCLELQSKVLDGWVVNEADIGCIYAKPGIYMCNMSRDIQQQEEDKPKAVGRPKVNKQ